MTTKPSESPIARFALGDLVTVLVGSKAGDHAYIEYVVWAERDHCYYFYLEQREPRRKLSRGYRGDELVAGHGDPGAPPGETG